MRLKIEWISEFNKKVSVNKDVYYEIRKKDHLENLISFCHFSGSDIFTELSNYKNDKIMEDLNV